MKSLIGNLTLCVGLGLASLAYTTPAAARTHVVVDVGVRVPPPLPRYERHPPARVGYAWTPGYWHWNGHRHLWVGGGWVVARTGYRQVPADWGSRGGNWRLHPAYWVR